MKWFWMFLIVTSEQKQKKLVQITRFLYFIFSVQPKILKDESYRFVFHIIFRFHEEGGLDLLRFIRHHLFALPENAECFTLFRKFYVIMSYFSTCYLSPWENFASIFILKLWSKMRMNGMRCQNNLRMKQDDEMDLELKNSKVSCL
jgi:hypothetical protein